MQMSPVGLGFGYQTTIHLRDAKEYPNDWKNATDISLKYNNPDEVYISHNKRENTVIATSKYEQKINKETFLNNVPFLSELAGLGMSFTYKNDNVRLSEKENPYSA